MGMKYKEVGGGSATGLADNFVQFLQQGLQTGSFGAGTASGQANAANPVGSTNGIAGVLNDILSGGAGNLGGSLAKMLQTQQANDVSGIRSRFGVGGGTAFGTPGQYAEATYRAQAAPQIATAVGGLQMNALSQLLPIIANLSGKGIAQREGTFQENPWMTAAKLGLQGAGAVAGFMAGGPGGAAMGAQMGGAAGGMFGGQPRMIDSPPPTMFNPASFNPMQQFGYVPQLGYA